MCMYYVTNDDKHLSELKIDSIAREVLETLLSELPEELQTADVAKNILKRANYIVDGAIITIQKK